MDEPLQREIETLRKLTIKQLKERYWELFGEHSPSFNHAHLFRRVAWRLQARSEGDLSERARERAAQLADDTDLRLRAPRRFWSELAQAVEAKEQLQAQARDCRLPAPGSILERLYRGQSIKVKVLEEGFEHDGTNYRSLSAVAHKVTGTRWNGFVFFALPQDGGHE